MKFAGISLEEPRIMGVINVSPESFFKGSIRQREDEIIETALKMLEDGASFIDIGAKSTAPYLENQIPVEEEIRRAVWTLSILRDNVDVPISIDTTNAKVAEEAIKVGADIINDISGLKGDPKMVEVAREYDVPLILCAHKDVKDFSDPVHEVINALQESLQIAYKNNIEKEKIAIDPAIGFLRPKYPPWYEWDSKVIANLNLLKMFGLPILVGVSRKSFIGAITGRRDPTERLAGSLGATAIAVWNGANIIRTHDVRETLDAIKITHFIKRFRE
ncbi:MAG TPA: dihydropteroate synthase [Thermococcaceae archaeon]|uniref:dihydropteroate synthase n=2 Tax=Thermococcus sibiricus TaxID=172049 RepID=C6A286_THESM|nr:dihydropteroate synthase [Thermococcus sibiricus]ACS89731.1 Dihydropteroate synthase [Thermococcus sibiricus MM 739]KUK17058.1 MAG: Dihydropteroate synthase [Thermococcus sibiricus]KUK28273.1 MAG: Dihydropteroate synthase [Thermococcus sp. 40_45]HII67232.1 dihydropteroate synthase [Thermococcaceae archaeon]